MSGIPQSACHDRATRVLSMQNLTTPPLFLLALLMAGPCAGQEETRNTSAHATEVRRIPAAEANQGVAADDRFLYAIDDTGKRAVGSRPQASLSTPFWPWFRCSAQRC